VDRKREGGGDEDSDVDSQQNQINAERHQGGPHAFFEERSGYGCEQQNAETNDDEKENFREHHVESVAPRAEKLM
jgi:hypothetical protein